MAESNPYDQRVDSVRRRLHDELVDATGQPADPHDVDRVVDAKAESLADAPVQEFVPLLIEHEARDELRAHGLHRDLPDSEATSETGEAANDRTRSPAEVSRPSDGTSQNGARCEDRRLL